MWRSHSKNWEHWLLGKCPCLATAAAEVTHRFGKSDSAWPRRRGQGAASSGPCTVPLASPRACCHPAASPKINQICEHRRCPQMLWVLKRSQITVNNLEGFLFLFKVFILKLKISFKGGFGNTPKFGISVRNQGSLGYCPWKLYNLLQTPHKCGNKEAERAERVG